MSETQYWKHGEGGKAFCQLCYCHVSNRRSHELTKKHIANVDEYNGIEKVFGYPSNLQVERTLNLLWKYTKDKD